MWLVNVLKSKRFGCYLLVLCAAVVSTGCASLFGSPIHNVRIDSTPQNASYTVTDEQGEQVAQGVTPDMVALRTSSSPFQAARYFVNFEHEDYPGKTNALNGKLSGWYYVNIFYNIIGALIIDPYTGAMYKLPNESRAVLARQPTPEREPVQ